MTNRSAPPWPAGSAVPRWARSCEGELRAPARYRVVEDSSTGDRYHIALYNDGFRQHLVIVTEPGEHTRVPAWRRTGRHLVKTYTHLRPFGHGEFRATVRYHLTFDTLMETRQG